MVKRKGYFLMLCMSVMVGAVLSGCSNNQSGKNTSDVAATVAANAEEEAEVAESEAPAEETEEPKDIFVNKTFVSKSKKANLYQKTYKPAGNPESSASLKSWKDSSVKKQLVKFVSDAVTKGSRGYIPPEDRIVVTDIDGTLIAEQATKINNDKMTKKTPAQVKDYLLNHQNSYFDKDKKRRYRDIVYQPMVEMYDYLKANGFEIYFVSGNCNSLTYAWANYYFQADYAHSIGSNLTLDYDNTDGFKLGPTGAYEGCWNEVKAYRIYNQIGKCPVIGFGNSDGDVHMLSWIKTNPDYKSLSVMINHDDGKREYEYAVESISKACRENGFLDAKMTKNFKEVFAKSNTP